MAYHLGNVEALAQGDTDFISTLVGVFLEEVPKDISLLEQAISVKHYQQIYAYAHKLKPNVDLLQMQDALNAITSIEAAANIEDIGLVEQHFTALMVVLPPDIVALQKQFS